MDNMETKEKHIDELTPMTVEDAKKNAQAVIKNLRYDKDEYFWINDMEPRMIMHGIKSEMNGQNLSVYKDPNGKTLFVAMVDICKSKGEGFVDYLCPSRASQRRF